jgi:hypothetical protein
VYSLFANISDLNPTVCSKCPIGRYSTHVSTYCTECPEGSFTNEPGQGDICSPCAAGTYSPKKASTFCLPCIVGKYNQEKGQTQCFDCPNASSTLQERVSSMGSCLCPSGSYGHPSSGTCLKCPPYRGMVCGVNSTVPFVVQGFWRSAENLALVQECKPARSCLATEFLSTSPCAEGYEGRRCGKCAVGRYQKNSY